MSTDEHIHMGLGIARACLKMRLRRKMWGMCKPCGRRSEAMLLPQPKASAPSILPQRAKVLRGRRKMRCQLGRVYRLTISGRVGVHVNGSEGARRLLAKGAVRQCDRGVAALPSTLAPEDWKLFRRWEMSCPAAVHSATRASAKQAGASHVASGGHELAQAVWQTEAMVLAQAIVPGWCRTRQWGR